MSSQRRNTGFTIVELLIVIVVIGILAAITIVAFNGVQNKARQASVQAATTQANKKILAYAALNSDQYPANLAAAGVVDTDTTYQYSVDNTVSPRTYGLTSTNGTVSYFVSSVSSQPVAGAYPGHGSGGVAPITNLVINPSAEIALTNIGTLNANTTLTRVLTATAPSGSYAIQAVNAGVGGGEGVGISINNVGFGSYTGSAVVWGSSTLNVWVRMLFTDGTLIESPKTTAVATATPQRFSATGTYADNGKIPSLVVLYIRTPVAQATTFFADEFMITSGTTLYNYADPLTSTNWVWNGAAHSATSTGPAL